MGFRLWRRFRIMPGVTINVSKSGPSLSLGPRGAKVTIGPRGLRGTAGLPGTGLFYTTSQSWQRMSGLGGSEGRSHPQEQLSSSPGPQMPGFEIPEVVPGKGVAVPNMAIGCLTLLALSGLLIGLLAGEGVTAMISALIAGAVLIGYPRLPRVRAAKALKSGKEALKLGKIQESMQALRECLSLAPDASQARYLLALGYFDIGARDSRATMRSLTEALRELDLIEDECVTLPLPSLLKAAILSVLKRYDDALNILQSLYRQQHEGCNHFGTRRRVY